MAARTNTRLASPTPVSFPAAAFWRSLQPIRNSVLLLLEASCSVPPPRELRRASISSTKMILGAIALASANNARTSFSLSPCHLLVSVLAVMAKNVERDSVATALASIVLPVPGGPKRSIPLAGSLRPEKRSGRRNG